MATEFIPFAQMTTAQKREHLAKAHGFSEDEIRKTEHNHGLTSMHYTDHRARRADVHVPHAHTKVSRRTKR